MECEKCDGTGKIETDWDESEFEDYLTDMYGDVTICGMEYASGKALHEIDPIAFDCAMSDTEKEDDCPDCGGSGEIEDETEDEAV